MAGPLGQGLHQRDPESQAPTAVPGTKQVILQRKRDMDGAEHAKRRDLSPLTVGLYLPHQPDQPQPQAESHSQSQTEP